MEWNIQARSRKCCQCGKPFADRQPVHTLLLAGEAGYERLDLCVPCWEQDPAAGGDGRPGLISHWQSVHLAPPPRTEPIQRESAETLLRRLLELRRPEWAGACFVLAVMLERKRILKMQGRSREDGCTVLHYEHPRSGEVFHVVDPELRLDQLEDVQRQVSRLLEHGLPEPREEPVESAEEAVAEGQGDSEEAPPAEDADSTVSRP
ncbi:MAG: hypothetical protein D6766_02930 [Verrucomicrobia bacterium]|nr:MAG: hypothetical protein D6766_02930 [Verrucomicrobiota bacterium]